MLPQRKLSQLDRSDTLVRFSLVRQQTFDISHIASVDVVRASVVALTLRALAGEQVSTGRVTTFYL